MSKDAEIPTKYIDPALINIRRDRQRQANVSDVEDLKSSLSVVGMINPIVVRVVDGEIFLVAGERRLRAARELGWKSIPVRFFEDLTEPQAEVVELEENVKRRDLHWRDYCKAMGRLHRIYKDRDESWTVEQTATAAALSRTQLQKILRVFDAIDSPRLAQAQGVEQAYNILQQFAERKAASIVTDIIAKGASVFSGEAATTAASTTAATAGARATVAATTTTTADNGTTSETFDPPPPPPPPPPPADPVLCADFLRWAREYSGPRFTLIHCDFPYGNYKGDDSSKAMASSDVEEFYDNHEEIYWSLLAALTDNLDRLLSYSAHLVFWFNMNFYTQTVQKLRATGLMVHDHPLIWHKTGGGGGLGVVPGSATTYPRRTYDTALLAVRGNRPLAKAGMNSYAAPTVSNKIHPSQKPEAMLRYFLSMVVDETTTMLDPTCGSGAALRAAEDLGAKSILGLELDPNYARAANAQTIRSRVMRQIQGYA